MSRLLLLGLALAPSFVAAQEPLIPRYREAEQGNAEAQVEVGHYYVMQYAKNHIGRNLDEARDWYGRAAKQRDTLGMMRLAELHLRPEPEVHDPAAAFEWYDRLYRSNRPGTGCNGALARFYLEGCPSADGKVKSAPDYQRAYYHSLLEISTGHASPEVVAVKNQARLRLTPADVKDLEDRAFRWTEDHNKPAVRLETDAEGAAKGGARKRKVNQDGKDKDGKDKDGKPTTTDEPVDTADKALELAIKNQQESARQVAPLGKPKRYLLPAADRDKK